MEKTVRNVFWMLMTGKAWEVLLFVLVLVFYGLLKCHIRLEVNSLWKGTPDKTNGGNLWKI